MGPSLNYVYLAIGALGLALATLGIGFFWGKATAEHDVRIEEVQAPPRTVTVRQPMVVTCRTTSRSLGSCSNPTGSSSESGSGSASDGGTGTETVVTVEMPSDIPTAAPQLAPVLVPVLPPWRLTGLAGYDFRTGTWTGGGGIEHHIAGPFYGGAWGLSTGVAGVSVSATF